MGDLSTPAGLRVRRGGRTRAGSPLRAGQGTGTRAALRTTRRVDCSAGRLEDEVQPAGPGLLGGRRRLEGEGLNRTLVERARAPQP